MYYEYRRASAMDMKYNPEQLNVFIKPDLLNEILFIAKNVETEVSGLGDVVKVKNGFEIVKLRFFEQECTASETEIKPEQLDLLGREANERGEDLSSMRLWWHSHAKMSTFWSGQDESCIKSLLSAFEDYLISIVVNHAGDLLCRMDFVKPIGITVNHVPVKVCYDMPEVKETELKDMIAKNVKTKYATYTYRGKGGGYRYEEEEPRVSGEYDHSIAAWKHKTTGDIWDWLKKEWIPFDEWEKKKKFVSRTRDLLPLTTTPTMNSTGITTGHDKGTIESPKIVVVGKHSGQNPTMRKKDRYCMLCEGKMGEIGVSKLRWTVSLNCFTCRRCRDKQQTGAFN